ncbi:hypothetical protein CXG81DRAFT_28443 [Caulochytrium protostelioides]|uniref:Cyclin-domain-containing protein n=1 Tax=Caulochytrium protostelioides TaxID=1555241 RepID=A0A4P9WYY1_9FUNG|nr:hypothetical protein CXG81DRAFT_28443 [Caulochytrium protostelioides]|eukprot:RKO98749.1 hypothetical protein CXG81DRAFT_28443 [Caulochytrium protostelioides]
MAITSTQNGLAQAFQPSANGPTQKIAAAVHPQHHTAAASVASVAKKVDHAAAQKMAASAAAAAAAAAQQQQQQQQQQQKYRPASARSNHVQGHDAQLATELADFVCYTVYRIWHAKSPLGTASNPLATPRHYPAFVKQVHRVIQTTGVALPVLLIALLYLGRLRHACPDAAGEGSEYRLFIVALVLSQKYLDDNRFTNRTWSEVSGIGLRDLNVVEIDFLVRIEWNMYVAKAEYTQWLRGIQMLGRDHSRRLGEIRAYAAAQQAAAAAAQQQQHAEAAAGLFSTPLDRPMMTPATPPPSPKMAARAAAAAASAALIASETGASNLSESSSRLA